MRYAIYLLLMAIYPSLPAITPFVIEKAQVETICKERGIDVYQLLNELVPTAKQFARPPISGYHVGIAGLGESGNIYLGVNIEFPYMPLNYTIHGEQFMVVNARMHGETKLIAAAQSAAPCGHCRQFYHEMGISDDFIILTPNNPSKILSTFLPEAFGPKDLNMEATLLTNSCLASSALEAANTSYAPYSGAKSGIAIQTKDGSIYTGAYLENAAFNPTLSPFHTAIIALVIGGKEYSEITEVI